MKTRATGRHPGVVRRCPVVAHPPKSSCWARCRAWPIFAQRLLPYFFRCHGRTYLKVEAAKGFEEIAMQGVREPTSGWRRRRQVLEAARKARVRVFFTYRMDITWRLTFVHLSLWAAAIFLRAAADIRSPLCHSDDVRSSVLCLWLGPSRFLSSRDPRFTRG
jgi:hypothetical protein